MLTSRQIRDRVLQGLAGGRLWRLARDQAKAREWIRGVCHVCDLPIARGHVYEVAAPAAPVRVHLECYLFWLHVSGAYRPEPVTCAQCRRVIPPHAEKVTRAEEAYHRRCWERLGEASPVAGARA